MFKVKAVYDYSSPHDDDLNFKQGQVITVTEEEGDDWYVGEYLDDSGAQHDGLFPRNFVERYEPAPPPRPNRASRHRPLEQPAVQAAPPEPIVEHNEPEPEPEPVQHEEPKAAQSQPPPVQVPPPAAKQESTPMSPTSPPSATSARSTELPPAPAVNEAVKPSPAPAPAAKKAPPPPVAQKSNAFRDRIAAFNAPAAAPIQPFKAGGAPSTFIKKPFVAPPPSRNAYVPPPKEAPQVKSYRRDEDPEIAERQAQDQDAADRAGLTTKETQHEEEEDNQPKISLKERIALLQKQQQEQAERAAAAVHKDKPKRPPPKKRVESHEGHAEDSEGTELERVATATSRTRESMDHARPPRTSHDIRSPDSAHHARDLVSENDADQSGADNTEDAEGSSTTVEEDDDRSKQQHPPLPIRAPTAPSHEPNVGDEQDVEEEEEEEEEDEMDAETRKKLETRERMAKLSGGMGMAGMFGPVPTFPKKKKTAEKQAEETEERSMPQQRVAMFPMGGMPSVKSPEQENRQLAVEKEDEEHRPVTSSHAADEIADVEDLTPQHMQRTPTGERPPPIPSGKFMIPRKPLAFLTRRDLDCCRSSPFSEVVSKTYTASDGASEYVMTLSVSSMFGGVVPFSSSNSRKLHVDKF